MFSNRLAFVALAIACIGAAAGGGYLATRQNTVPTPASAQAQPAAIAPAAEAAAAPAHVIPDTDSVGTGAPKTAAPAGKTSIAKPVEPTVRVGASREARRAEIPAAHHEPAPAASIAAAPQLPSSSAPMVESTPPPLRSEEHALQEPLRAVEPPQRLFEELVVSADSVIGLQIENRVSSDTARVEDRVDGRVTRDVRVGGRVAIPAGARVVGSVMQVDRGGKLKERAHLGIRFHTLVLADGSRLPIVTETIWRDGEAPSASSSQKIGGAAVGGAILGAIIGGGKGMAIGAAAGAGAGSAAVAAGDRSTATLAAGTSMTVRILQPITITSDGK